MTKNRESNFELCRVLSMIMVLLYHSTFNTFGFPSSVENCRLGIIILSAFSIIGVNVFVLLTGYFSVRPKRKSIANILFICFFYMLLKILYDAFVSVSFVPVNLLFISSSGWFVVVYLGLLLFAPMLNDFIESCGRKELGCFIILLFLYETWFGFFPGIAHGYGFSNGYSVISFVLIYLIGRYLRLYGLGEKLELVLKCSYPLLSALFVVMFYLAIASGIKGEKMAGYICGYNNPVIMLASVSFLLLFKSFKIEGASGKVINYVAQSNLAVLLIHACNEFFPFYSAMFRYIDENMKGVEKGIIWLTSVIIIYLICVLIDQARLLCWKMLQKTNAIKIE